MDHAIVVTNLRKTYGATTAVDDVTFEVQQGEIFGIVGPNGAGKTTIVETMIGLRRLDSGSVRVLGLDPEQDGRALRERIGIQLQHAALSERIKVREALQLYSALYARSAPWEPLLAQWGLVEKLNAAFSDLSGGQQQRLFITLALINDPEIVVLDELTAGLDPQARRATWDLIREIRAQGKTVVLVTHFMEEAERLCDRVAVIDHGRVIALAAPAALDRTPGHETRVCFSSVSGFDPSCLRHLPGVSRVTVEESDIVVTGNGFLMAEVATALAQQRLAPPDLRTEQTTLEDVFLSLTGRAIRD